MVGCRLLLTYAILLSSVSAYTNETSFQRVEHQPEGGVTGEGGVVEGGGGGVGGPGILRAAMDSLWEKVRPYIVRRDATNLEDRLATFRRLLLTEAEDLVSLFTRAAHDRLSGGQSLSSEWTAEEEPVQEKDSGQRQHRTKRDHPLDSNFVRDPDGLPILSKVEGVADLGVRGSQAVQMFPWHDRLLVAIIDNTMNVSVFSLDQHLGRASQALKFPARHSCGLTVAPGDQLLMGCIAPFASNRYATFYEKIQGDVTIYQLKEGPGEGNLTRHFRQKITTENSEDLTMWTQNDRNFLLVADSLEVTERFVHRGGSIQIGNKTNYHTTSRLYHWTGEYFDVLQELPGTNPRSVKHFVIFSMHFIAVANYQNNRGLHNCHSLIYRYSLDADHYLVHQEILTKGAVHFESFTLGQNPYSDSFLAVANHCEDSEFGPCNPNTLSKIYRYQYGKFVLFQEIPTSYAVQWLAIQVQDNVLLAVANSLSGVKFYQYNGWRFVPTVAQYYAGPFGPGVTRMAAVTWNGSVILGVTNRDSESSTLHIPTLYTVTFRRDRTMQQLYEVSEQWCDKRREQTSQEKVALLLQEVRAAPDASLPYSFTQPVTIVGNLTVKVKSEAHQVYIRGSDHWLPDIPNHFEARRLVLLQDLQRGQQRLSDAIPVVGPATWPAGLRFEHLDALESSGIFSVENLLAVRLNAHDLDGSLDPVRVTDLADSLHLERCDFSHVEVQAGVKVSSLVGRPMGEYVTLSGAHSIGGEVTFLEEVRAVHVGTSGPVDGLFVSRNNLLLTTFHQNHTGSISCTSLEARSLYVNTVNNINFSQLLKSIIIDDGLHTITGQLVVRGDLIYAKSLEVNVTSNVDFYNPLRTDDPETQVITVEHRVESVRSESVSVFGRLNSVLVPEEVFLSRPSGLSYTVASASFVSVFAESVTVDTALDNITVTDGQLDVLTVSGSQTVTANKVFSTIQLLQEDTSSSSGYSPAGLRRRRRDLGGRNLTEAEGRREALLWNLRGAAAAQDLLNLLAEAQPGTVTLSHDSVQFYNRLAQDVPCAFSLMDEDYEGMRFDLHNLNWKREEEEADFVFLQDNITILVENVEKCKLELDEMLNLPWDWHDVFAIATKTRTPCEEDLFVLVHLIDAVSNRQSNRSCNTTDHDACHPYPEMGMNTSIAGVKHKRCLSGFLQIVTILRRLCLYPPIVNNMTAISHDQRKVLQTTVVEHGIGKLLEVIRDEDELRRDLEVASACGTVVESREGNEKFLRILESYKQKLEEFLSPVRTKRDVAEPEESSRTSGLFKCSDLPQHFYESPSHAREVLQIFEIALQSLYNINSTRPWDFRVTEAAQDVAFETYFRHYTHQIGDIFHRLYEDPLNAAYTFDKSNLTALTSGFILLVDHAKKFDFPLSSTAQEELDFLGALLLPSREATTKVFVCLKLLLQQRGDEDSPVDYSFDLSFVAASASPNPKAPSASSGESGKGSWVLGLVAGHRLQDLQRSKDLYFLATNQPVQYVLTQMDRIRHIFIEANLNVSLVNGVDVNRINRHGLLTTVETLTSQFTFTQAVVVSEEVTAERINQVSFSGYVTLDGDHVFQEAVVFTESVTVERNVALLTTVNGVDLTEFSRSVVVTSAVHQVIHSSITFTSIAALDMDSKDGNVTGTLFNDFVLLNESAVITGKKTFLEVEVREGRAQAGRLTTNFINGVNVNKLFLDSLRKNPDGIQVFSTEVQLDTLVLQDLTTRGFVAPRTSSVLYIPRLAEKAVYKDQNNIITGELVLKGATSIEALIFVETFDTVSSTRYNEGWLLKTPDQVISGQLYVANMTSNVFTGAPGVKIQGVDLVQLKSNAFLIDEPQVLAIPLRFGEVVSLSEVDVSGLVQGLDLSRDSILRNSSNVVFTASKTFLASVHVRGSLTSAKGLGGTDLSSVCERLSLRRLEIYGKVRFQGAVYSDVVFLGRERITGEDLGGFWMVDRGVLLQEPIVLQEVVVVAAAAGHHLAGTVNGVDLSDLGRRVLLKTCSGSQLLLGSVHIGSLKSLSLFTNEVLTTTINSSPMSDLLNILTVDGPQIISGHWRVGVIHALGNLVTSHLINWLRITQFCQLRKPCIIQAKKIFNEDVIVSGNHYVEDDRTVQKVDVSVSFGLAVTRSNCGYIPGLTTFTENLLLPRIVVRGTVDGITVSSDVLLTSSGDQVMSDHLVITVKQGVALRSEIVSAQDGLFNSINLTELQERAFDLARNNTVRSSVSFLVHLVFEKVLYNGAISQRTLATLRSIDFSSHEEAFHRMKSMNYISKWALKDQVREFAGWRRVQQFRAMPERIVALRTDWREAGATGALPLASHYLALITSRGDTNIYVYSNATLQYHDSGIVLPGNCTRSVVGYRSQGRTILVTGHACYGSYTDYWLYKTQVVAEESIRVYSITSTGDASLISSFVAPGAAHLEVFWWRGVHCLVMVEALASDTVLLCEHEPGHFEEHQRLRSVNPRKATVSHHLDPTGRNSTFLVVADSGESTSQRGGLHIWKSDPYGPAFVKLQELDLRNVEWVEMVSQNTDLFLVVLSEAFRDTERKVYIYRLDWFGEDGSTPLGHFGTALFPKDFGHGLYGLVPSPRFYFVQELEVDVPLEARFSLLPSGRLVLYIINEQGFVIRFSQKGIHRFWEEGRLHLPKKRTLEAWVTEDQGRLVHRISVAGERCLGEEVFLQEPAVVLEAFFRGGDH